MEKDLLRNRERPEVFKMTTYCTATIYQGLAWYSCGKKAQPGTDRCGLHSKEAVARRQAKSAARYAVHTAARHRQQAAQDAATAVLDAARTVEAFWTATGQHPDLIALLAAVRALNALNPGPDPYVTEVGPRFLEPE
jgi:hypothetical protein